MDIKKVGEIEKGVPVPDTVKTRRYPFEEMEPGDSFFIETKDRGGARNSAMSCACRFGKDQNPKRTFCGRQVDGGVRVWRVL